MKLVSFKSVKVSALTIVILSVAACTSVKKSSENFSKNVQYDPSPKVLELHGDSVEYEVSVTVPAKKFHKKASVKIEPVLNYGNDKASRPPITLHGENAKGKPEFLIDSKTGGTVKIKDKFAYDSKMKKSELVAKGTFMLEGEEKELNQCIDLKEEIKIADGVITTSTMLKSDEDVLVSIDEYVPVSKTQNIEVFYLINTATFNPKYKDAKAGLDNAKQIAELTSLLSDPNFVIKGLNFNSYASPDGELERNEGLANDRSAATVAWFKQYLKKYGRYEMFDSNFQASNYFKEDWKGWKALVQASDLEDKDAIVAIIDNNNMSDDDKEVEIRTKHKASFEKMKVNMLPKLRRSTIMFTADGGQKTNDELKTASMDELSQSELLQKGKLSATNTEKKQIYGYFIGKYSSDWRGYNNLAVTNLQMGEADEALNNLVKADQLSPNNAIVLNNLGVAHKMKRNYKESEDKYRAAKAKADANVNPNYNMGVLYTRMGKYDKAIESYGSSNCRYNVGLAYLLKKDYDNAEKALNCIPADKKDAATYYLLAVTGARKNSLDAVATNLARAFQMDASLKAKAKEDMEFRDFKSKPEFEALFR